MTTETCPIAPDYNIRRPVTLYSQQIHEIEQALINIAEHCPGITDEIDRIRRVLDAEERIGRM